MFCRIHVSLLLITILLVFPAAALADDTAAALADDTEPTLEALPNSVPTPSDNPATPAKIQLGKKLFFDPRLSGNNDMSCGSCHLADKGWADGLALGKGDGGQQLSRNTPTLLNAVFYKTFLWDGRAASLEQQSLGPIQMPAEMNQDLDELVQELRQVPDYVTAFDSVFGRPINSEDIAKALAAFERTLVTRNSPFDRYLAGDRGALSAEAKEGLRLFQGDADCVRCHNGPLLSDGKFYRLGIGQGDKGRGGITGKQEDLYKFRTPSLRDVARTAPYMHDGSKATLYDVVEFYYRSAPSQGPDGMPLDIEPLTGQSFSEIDAIVAFLESLNGDLPEVGQ